MMYYIVAVVAFCAGWAVAAMCWTAKQADEGMERELEEREKGETRK